MHTPIFLTEQELIRAVLVLRRNAALLKKFSGQPPSVNNGLSAQDQIVLEYIWLCPNERAQDIARDLHLSRPNLSRCLRRLTAQGYLNAERESGDLRVKRLHISTKGKQAYTQCQQNLLQAFYSAYQKAGITAVKGYIDVQRNLADALKANIKRQGNGTDGLQSTSRTNPGKDHHDANHRL